MTNLCRISMDFRPILNYNTNIVKFLTIIL